MFIIIALLMARRARDVSLATSTLYLSFKGNHSNSVDKGSVRETSIQSLSMVEFSLQIHKKVCVSCAMSLEVKVHH